MLLSHAAGAFGPVSDSRLPKALFEIGRIASPTFVMISGLLLGFLYRTTRPFAATRTKFIDRGLFLLTVGHLLLCGALRPHADLARWLMLDVMGIALITGATLIPGIGRPLRLVLSAVVYTGSWLMIG